MKPTVPHERSLGPSKSEQHPCRRGTPNKYLRFVNERTRPCRDLVTAIAVEAPRRIVDLGCGPGYSTAVLAARWPAAEITGLDNSEAMITEALMERTGFHLAEG